jgi:hypothetical protein
MTEPTFTVGPPQPVNDSRLLPAVTADEEAGFVDGAAHPDNRYLDPDAALTEELPGDEELAAVVADVDPDAVDGVGFDDSDLAAALAGAAPSTGEQAGGV